MKKPSLAWLAVAVLIAVATAGLFAWQLFDIVHDVMPRRGRLPCPGEATIDLPAPGTHALFFENRSLLDGRSVVSTGEPGDFVVSIVPAGEQEPLALRAGGSFRYSSPWSEGFAFRRFTTARGGPHVVSVTRATAGSRTGVIAIGDAVDPLRFGLRIAGTVVIAVIGFHAAVLVAVIVVVQRFGSVSPPAA